MRWAVASSITLVRHGAAIDVAMAAGLMHFPPDVICQRLQNALERQLSAVLRQRLFKAIHECR